MNIPGSQTTLGSAKSGFFSSEFWLTVLTVGGLLLDKIPPQYAPYVTIASAVYAAGRSIVKSLHAAGLAKQIPDLPDLGAGNAAPTVGALPPGSMQTTTTVLNVPK